MKITAIINSVKGMIRLRHIISLLALTALFGYMYTRGIPPVWAAVAVTFFRGLAGFLYRIACVIVTALLLLALLGAVVF